MKKDINNCTLIDVQYIKPRKDTGYKDYLYIIYRDDVSGEKFIDTIENPKMDIYFTKPECRDNIYPKEYEELSNLEVRRVEYKNILDAIAFDSGPKSIQFLANARRSGDRRKSELLYAYPYVYGADIDIRQWYRFKWLNSLSVNKVNRVTKGFYDIEVDTINSNTSTPSPIDCPINAVTIINNETKTVFTFVLTENRGDDQQVKDVVNDKDGLIEECHAMFDDVYGDDFDYKVYFYDDEIRMIIHVFQLFNQLKLDLVGSWSYFDIEYFISRIKALGMDPVDVMCHPDFKVKECYFKKDMFNFSIKNKSDHFYCSSYTTYIDQMKVYAGIRKGQSELRRFSLNAISQKELGDSKIEYGDDGTIKTLAYRNFRKFILYNIKDTLLQWGIENKVHDFDNIYLMSYVNCVPYENVFKQTSKVGSIHYQSFFKQGVIQGNNINRLYLSEEELFQIEREIDDEEEDESEEQAVNGGKSKDVGYEGALVADPVLNNKCGEKLYGLETNFIFKFVIDMDMTAFYPSAIMGMNIAPSTLIFKAIIYTEQFKTGNAKCNTKFELGNEVSKEIFDNYQTGNILNTANKWLGLPSIDDVYHILKDRM